MAPTAERLCRYRINNIFVSFKTKFLIPVRIAQILWDCQGSVQYQPGLAGDPGHIQGGRGGVRDGSIVSQPGRCVYSILNTLIS